MNIKNAKKKYILKPYYSVLTHFSNDGKYCELHIG
jgi:hypothetical protein